MYVVALAWYTSLFCILETKRFTYICTCLFAFALCTLWSIFMNVNRKITSFYVNLKKTYSQLLQTIIKAWKSAEKLMNFSPSKYLYTVLIRNGLHLIRYTYNTHFPEIIDFGSLCAPFTRLLGRYVKGYDSSSR